VQIGISNLGKKVAKIFEMLECPSKSSAKKIEFPS